MSNEKQFRCSAEKEGGHSETYLTWVHQADGFCYWRCDVCGWIKPDMKKLKSHDSEYVSPLTKSCLNCKYYTTLSDHCHGCMRYYYSKWVEA